MAISENIKSSISVSINDGDARQRLEALRQRIARLNKERETLMQKPLDLRTDKEQKRLETLTSANKELTRVRAVGTEVVNTLGKLDTASAKELERTIKSLRREMESGSIERGSELWNKYSTALRAAENELEAVREEMRGVGTDTENQIGGSLKGIESFVEKITNAFQRMRAWAEPYVEAFAAIDDEMVGVMKYTGLARTEVEQLDQALLQINTRTTHEQLLQLAQDAGRLGIQSKEDILAFVRAADTINLALGEDLGEDAIRNIAKLAQIFGDAEQLGLERAMLATASTINELAQSSTAAEPYLAEFASRLGSIGATAGLTQAQILAYASVMDQSGINVERAATALQNVIMRLYQDPAKAAEVAGLEVKAFTDLIRTDANEALLQWAQAMGNMKGGLSDTAPALKSLHMAGSGVSEMIMNLANNTTLLRTTQQQATAAFQQATSATNEAAAAQSSAAARLEILKNRISQAREEIGQRLAPAFIASTGTLLLFTRALAAIISVALSPWFIGATAAIAAYTVAVNASIIADQLKALWTNNVRTALVKLYATAKAHPWGIVLAAIGALIGYLISLREKTEEITEAQRALARAQEQAEQSAAAETSRLRRLYEATQDQTLAMEQRIAAAEALQRQYPDYFGKLNTEAILAGKAADAYADLTQQIIAAARARAMESEIEELEKKNLQLRRERQEAQRRYETARQASDNAYAGGTGAGGVGGAAFAGAAAGISADRYLQTVNSIDRQIEANNQAINTLAKSVNNLQTTVNRATNAAHAATSAITASYSGTSGKSRKSGNTTHTPPKETPQQAANRERQERLQLAQKQLQRTDLTNEVRTILQAIVKQIQEDIRLNPNAPIGKPRTPRTSGNSRKSGTSRTSAPTTTPATTDFPRTPITPVKELAAAFAAPEAIGLSAAAAETLAQNIAALNADLAEGIIPATAYTQALQQLYIQAREQTALEDLQKKLDDINRAEQQGIITHQQAIILQRQAKRQRQEQVRQLTPIAEAQLPQNTYSDAVRNIYNELNARRQALQEIERLEQQGVITHQEAEERRAEISAQKNQHIVAAANQAYQLIAGFAQQYTTYLNAQRDAEVQRITQTYDAQLAQTKEGTKAYSALEEKKQAAIAAVKNKYNRRAQAIELAQALASVALSAINAYSSAVKVPLVGTILAPIAAATAIAAGMLQVATIRKQHEAQAQGYLKGGYVNDPNNPNPKDYIRGGYTQKGNRHKPAGIVHAGEFVATSEAVQSPTLRPMLDLIDQAQKRGTISRLTPADLITTAAGTITLRPASPATNTGSAGVPARISQRPPPLRPKKPTKKREPCQKSKAPF